MHMFDMMYPLPEFASFMFGMACMFNIQLVRQFKGIA